MKTLLFLPLFLDEGQRMERNLKWLDFIVPLKDLIGFDEILFVDNASGIEKLKEFENKIKKFEKKVKITVIKRQIRLTRWKANAYGFWYCAFAKGTKYALENNYEKIIHIDSDVYPLNQKICTYLKNLNLGWSSLYCFCHNFPETTLQVICKDQFELAHRWFTEDFLEFYPEGIAETRIPWTHVEKGFNGDRFGEKNLPQTPEMDWYGQCPVNIPMRFNK